MHADLAKLLDLQSKDTAVAAVEERLQGLRQQMAVLDAALAQARASAEAARRAVAASVERRTELEAKIEAARATQQKRQQRLDAVRNPKEAAAVMAEVDLAGAVLAREEAEWVRGSELLEQQERQARELEEAVAAAEAAQRPDRERIAAELRAVEREHAAAADERAATAEQVERTLRHRYDRLRRSRGTAVVVPLAGNTCGACFTAVPLSRRTAIKTGQAIEGCEACGAILYPPNAG